MAARQVNLAKVFQTVATTLASQKQALNQADSYNHDHGDHMVEVFEVVTQAMKAKKGASAADQLAYASQLLRQRENGSAKYYAGGLSQAAQMFQGQKLTSDNILQLVQILISGGQQTTGAPAPAASAGDPLAALLGGLGGGGQEAGAPAVDIGGLLQAGMSFLNAKQRGQGNVDALMGALLAGTQGGSSPYRAQSGALVANAVLQAIGGRSSRG
ncbi:MAG TPA: hypothetical protein VFI11_08245 [Anaerolineales bacterium]|nr:hypothetical protein [Anaerolineales bacterium]